MSVDALDLLLIGTGLVVSGIGLWDQAWTILGEGGGPITRRVAKSVRQTSQHIYRVLPRSRVLSIGGAVAVVATVFCWIWIQWVAWTLVFSGLEVVNATTSTMANVWERIYFSGYTLSTLGIGNVQPRGPAALVLTAGSSFVGLVQISFAIGYIIPMMVAATDKRRIAITISCLGESSRDVLVNMWDGDSFEALRHYLEAITPELAFLEQRHLSYPILAYFHSHKRSEAIGPSLAVLDETVTLLQRGTAAGECGHLGIPSGTLHAVRRSLSTLIETLATALEASGGDLPPPPDLDQLRDAGIPVVPDAQFDHDLEEMEDRRRTLLYLVEDDGWTWDAVATSDTERDDEQLSSLYDTEAI
ncbi:hypothetical protein [Rubrivirga sp.]|uniref:hypothetical protein n=1 Tax=Rubrivirga sp. TaxID=1885344 RepID=UPI003C708A1A